MVEFDFTEEITTTSVITGGRNQRRFLYYQLKMSIQKASRIDIIVSFLMESGVRLILTDLKEALSRGAKIRILTGNYLGITQPSALYLLKQELGSQVDLRFYNDPKRSFHPKSYFFHYQDLTEMYIGSSNISRSALTSGIEWNYRLNSLADRENLNQFYETFEDLFANHSIIIDDEELKSYSKNWHIPAVYKDFSRHETDPEDVQISPLFIPRGAQIEALYALNNSRAEGATKALVQAATGIGKTYLAAFDSAPYQRILFVAHREEILTQAAASFANVRKSDDYGYFTGQQKDTDKAVIFASVATLGRPEYLSPAYFPSDYFDYIVIDEFHHAVNHQYRRIADYFTPKFLLGLTATPERLDGRNIYELCDYNVPYEISLMEAINKGLLVPFHYYGIYDETDYSNLRVVRGSYQEEDLNKTYIGNARRYELIYKYYEKYPSKRALGFCCSKQHAEDMAREFCRRGIPAAAVYSGIGGEYTRERSQALDQLRRGELRVLFAVDMFNEGLDITELDMVMFLRPTQSPVVFLQQLGRGLRKSRGKAYLNVLDFIGNYQKASRIPGFLGKPKADLAVSKADLVGSFPGALEYPDDCIVDFDMRLIDLFREMDRRTASINDRIRREYYRIKELLEGRRPTRMDLFTEMDDQVYQLCIRTSKQNPFRQYLEYLHGLGELSAAEKSLYQSPGREFLSLLETTNMQKVYKMPVLLSFYNHGDIRMAVTDDEILAAWKEFFNTGTNWKDLRAGITHKEFIAITDRSHLTNIKKNPVNFLLKSGQGYFQERPGAAIAIRADLEPVVKTEVFREQMGDVISYRIMEYYRRRYQDGN